METPTREPRTTPAPASALSLHDAAQAMAGTGLSAHDAARALAQAIEHGELHANVKRWASEQWEGHQLPGNINPQETFVERSDLEAWLAARPRAPDA